MQYRGIQREGELSRSSVSVKIHGILGHDTRLLKFVKGHGNGFSPGSLDAREKSCSTTAHW